MDTLKTLISTMLKIGLSDEAVQNYMERFEDDITILTRILKENTLLSEYTCRRYLSGIKDPEERIVALNRSLLSLVDTSPTDTVEDYLKKMQLEDDTRLVDLGTLTSTINASISDINKSLQEMKVLYDTLEN